MALSLVSPLSRTLYFLRKHPLVSCLLLLPLSAPIYRIILYFTPLLLSTTLCIFALITLTPYVTATGAQVERQSMHGSASHLKKTSIISYTAFCDAAELSCIGSDATLPQSSQENSWLSWMKGLNDIGRTWIESKLKEQGLALSEPANRETLLSLIEGSFAELITMKDLSVEVLTSIDTIAEIEVMPGSADALETLSEGGNDKVREVEGTYHESFTTEEETEVGAFLGVNEEMIDTVRARDEAPRNTLPSDAVPEQTPPTEATADVRASKKEHLDQQPTTEVKHSLTGLDTGDTELKNHENDSIMSESSHMPGETEAASSIPRTPSKISAPSKLLEASRRFFSKEENVNTGTVPRSHFEALSMPGKQTGKALAESPSSKDESAPTGFKSLRRNFLDRSRILIGKDGGKFSSSSSLVESPIGKDQDGAAEACPKSKTAKVRFDLESSTNENVVLSCSSDLEDGGIAVSKARAPKFDAGPEIEKVQALVRSELVIFDMENEELAARLPKHEDSADYEKTPARRSKASATTSNPTTPSAAIRSTTSMFVSPNAK